MSNLKDSEIGKSQLEHAWRTHAYLNEYIKVADAKAGVVVAIAGALCVFVLQSKRFAGPSEYSFLSYGSVFCLAMAFVFGFLVIAPVLFTKDTIGDTKKALLQSIGFRETPKGLIFWNAIRAHNDPDKYVQNLKEQDSQGLLDAVAYHTYELSAVAQRKFNHLAKAFYLLVIGITASVIFFSVNQWDLSTRVAEPVVEAKP